MSNSCLLFCPLRVKKQEKEKGISAAIESNDKDEKKKKKK